MGSWVAQFRRFWLTGERQPWSVVFWTACAAAACGSTADIADRSSELSGFIV